MPGRRRRAAKAAAIAAFLLANLAPAGSPTTLALLAAAATPLDFRAQASLVVGFRAIFALGGNLRGRLNSLYIVAFFRFGALGSALGATGHAVCGWRARSVSPFRSSASRPWRSDDGADAGVADQRQSRLTLATSVAEGTAWDRVAPAGLQRPSGKVFTTMAWVRGAPMWLVFLGLAGLAGLTLSGCETDLAGALGGPAVAATTARPVQVFVASTRKGEHGAAAQALSSDGVHYALDIVTIPPGHHAGSIEEPMFGAANPHDHIVLANERTLDPDEFRSELASHVSGRIGVNRDVLVFVHGFNTPFDEARNRAAQIVADSRFGGVAVLFTWPTKHELFGYVSDKDNATASRDALQTLLQDISATPGVGKVHVLAHSMGGWLAMEALRQAAIAGDRDLSGHLGDVMLASPDIDMDVFAGQMARLRPANVTVFATANDRALSLSSAIAQSRQRVGGINPSKPEDREKLEALGAKVYDLTNFNDGFIDHGAYADAPDVLHAIGAQMAAPRPQDANTMSTIDASNYVDPSAPAAPAAVATPAATPAAAAPPVSTAAPTTATAPPATAPTPAATPQASAAAPVTAPTPLATPN